MNKHIKIGFTGTQKGLTTKQLISLKEFLDTVQYKILEFHHGDCIGADTEFHNICSEYYSNIIIHPPIYENKRSFCKGTIILDKKDYLDRNHDIVDDTHVLLVCPKEYKEQLRSGTWATFRYAVKKNKPIFIFYPNGKIKEI